MSKLDAADVQRSLTALTQNRLDRLESFSSIASTNTHLLSQQPPPPGRFRVAIADQQISGRGRHSRRWFSPPGSGLYLSLAYTFDLMRRDLPALTLALGVGIIDALARLGFDEISLKWPNDIVARDSKLGGILTEVQAGSGDKVTVVTGVGINIDMSAHTQTSVSSDWAQQPIDLQSLAKTLPTRAVLAGTVIESLVLALVRFEVTGFDGFVEQWRRHDWLRGRDIIVDTPEQQLSGVAAGVDTDGALLLDTGSGRVRVISGSIIIPASAGSRA